MKLLQILPFLILTKANLNNHGFGFAHHHHEYEDTSNFNDLHNHDDAHSSHHGGTPRCNTHNPSQHQQKVDQMFVDRYRNQGRHLEVWPAVEITTWIHVIDRNIAKDRIVEQMAVLNNAFLGIGFNFTYQIHYIDNDDWNLRGYETVTTMMASLRQGEADALNVYINTGGLVFASFPFGYASKPALDGVVIDSSALSGSNVFPFDEGASLVHEVGHWLGLYHVFEGSCGTGDFVDDTPGQSAPVLWICIPGMTDPPFVDPDNEPDTCPGDGGLDPIHNYMSYSTDSCMDNFTPGQVERMRTMWSAYRSSSDDSFCPDLWVRRITPISRRVNNGNWQAAVRIVEGNRLPKTNFEISWSFCAWTNTTSGEYQILDTVNDKSCSTNLQGVCRTDFMEVTDLFDFTVVRIYNMFQGKLHQQVTISAGLVIPFVAQTVIHKPDDKDEPFTGMAQVSTKLQHDGTWGVRVLVTETRRRGGSLAYILWRDNEGNPIGEQSCILIQGKCNTGKRFFFNTSVEQANLELFFASSTPTNKPSFNFPVVNLAVPKPKLTK